MRLWQEMRRTGKKKYITKSTLKWYRLAKDDVERYMRWVQREEIVRMPFRLRTGSAGLLEDKKRCRMVSDECL